VEPVPRQIQGARVTGLIEVSQHILDAPDLIGPDAARVVALEQAFQSLVAKRLKRLWYRTSYRYGCQTRKYSALSSCCTTTVREQGGLSDRLSPLADAYFDRHDHLPKIG
jgi:hypothetical protein